MATIAQALAQVRAALVLDPTLADLAHPDNPPDLLNPPAWVAYVGSGGLEQATLEGEWDGVYTIVVETHVARKNLAAAYASLMTYLPLINAQLTDTYTDNRFGGTVMLVGGGRQRGGTFPLRFDVAQDSWADTDTLALTHEFDVRLAED